MKLALIGTGQMGSAVDRLAEARGHAVVARFDGASPFACAGVEALHGAELAIDFSLPSTVLGHIERCCAFGLPLVVGTTGWYDALGDVQRWVAQSEEAAVLYAPNFSLGVAVLAHALRATVPLLDRLPDFDVALHEAHHVRKADSPSGTAHYLAGLLVDGLARKTHAETEAQHGPIRAEALHVTSTRLGHVFGEHTVTIDGPYDRLTLAHSAKSRDGFAYGALTAARWLHGRTGLFTLDDLVADWFSQRS